MVLYFFEIGSHHVASLELAMKTRLDPVLELKA